jgi:holliday junction DNA helicase RuvA
LSEGARTVPFMISRLRGTVVVRTPAGLVLDVGGVGYLVAATPRVTARVGEEATVETHLHVREDALQLYGFASADERELFELLLGVSGIGPKVALAIVSGSPPAELRRAIARDDLARFEAIPGIGRKTAQRVVMELKDKLAEPASSGSPGGGLLARDALVELGWSVVDADRVLADVDEALSVEEQVRAALKRAA